MDERTYKTRIWELVRRKNPLLVLMLAGVGVVALISSFFVPHVHRDYLRLSTAIIFVFELAWFVRRYLRAQYLIVAEQASAFDDERKAYLKLLKDQEAYEAGCQELSDWIAEGTKILNKANALRQEFVKKSVRDTYGSEWVRWVTAVKEGAPDIDKNLGHELRTLTDTDQAPEHRKFNDERVDLGIRMITSYIRLMKLYLAKEPRIYKIDRGRPIRQ